MIRFQGKILRSFSVRKIRRLIYVASGDSNNKVGDEELVNLNANAPRPPIDVC